MSMRVLLMAVGGGDIMGQRCVLVCVHSSGAACVCVSVGLEVLRRSFLVSLRRSAVVKEKAPALSGMNITR